MNDLTSPAITELTTEDGALNVMGEWVAQWFNATPQVVGANGPVLFPGVNIAFNQSPAVQPLFTFGAAIDTTIRIVMVPRNEQAESLDTCLFAGKLATDRVLFNFYVQAKHPGDSGGAAEQQAQTVGKLLKAILTNPDSRYPLVAKGITAFAPEPMRMITSVDYAQRLVACGAQLQYPIRFGTQPIPPSGG